MGGPDLPRIPLQFSTACLTLHKPSRCKTQQSLSMRTVSKYLVYASTYVRVRVCACICVRVLRVCAMCVCGDWWTLASQSSALTLFEAGLLLFTAAVFRLLSSASSQISSSPPLREHWDYRLAYYTSSESSNSDLYVCIASGLAIEPSP